MHYENYKIQLEDDSWVFVTPEKLEKELIIGKEIEGNVVFKRTREWLE